MRITLATVPCALGLSICLLGMLAVVPEICSAADAGATQPADTDNTAVRTGREALSAPPDRFPWYDAEHDALRRVELGPSSSTKSMSGRRCVQNPLAARISLPLVVGARQRRRRKRRQWGRWRLRRRWRLDPGRFKR